MKKVVISPMTTDPISMAVEFLDPVIRNATTIPGNTACEMASPTMAIRRKTKKQPNKLQLIETKEAVKII